MMKVASLVAAPLIASILVPTALATHAPKHYRRGYFRLRFARVQVYARTGNVVAGLSPPLQDCEVVAGTLQVSG